MRLAGLKECNLKIHFYLMLAVIIICFFSCGQKTDETHKQTFTLDSPVIALSKAENTSIEIVWEKVKEA
jgi:hypothetical protein